MTKGTTPRQRNGHRPHHAWGWLPALLLLGMTLSCSTKKNTAGVRFYHSTTARYNTLYNGKVAFLAGEEAQMKGHKEDYTRLLPMYLSTNKSTANMGKSNYETAITKCEKAIKVHSIKKRPVVKNNKKKTPKLKAYLARKEFNPVLSKAWLLMGEAQFRRGDFIEAASTYNYIMRLYATQPDVVSVAKARLARCYVALEWPYDAEDLLNKMKRDSISALGAKERDNTTAAYLILTHQYTEAIPYLKAAIKNTPRKQAKARLNFLLGQLYHETGDNAMAYKSLSRVIRSNPPYELSFNARIKQTEVMPRSKFHQMIALLKRMVKSDKNKNYLDQVYFAMGNIYLGVQDTTRCIWSWEKGVEEGKQNGISKAVLLLRLSQLYWDRENYIDAARTYKLCVGMLDKEHEEYQESDRRSKILTELEPHLSAIKLQDSLQILAKLPEDQCLAAIDRVINDLKKKEKEAEKKAAANGTPASKGGNQGAQPAANNANRPANNAVAGAAGGPKGAWYFYNPQAVKQGQQEFQRKWGQRPNEDNWRISNKTALLKGDEAERYNYDEAAADSLYGVADKTEGDLSEEEQALKDSLANDPHHREFYLKQIPFTEEQMAESNRLLSDGLYHAGILEQERLENFPLAEKTMLRLLQEFPDRDDLDDIYYHLFLLYGRWDNQAEAEKYRELLLEAYPGTKLAALLGNPNYELIARDGKHVEDSIYNEAYEAYKAEDYATVERNYQFSTENFPEGRNRARMMFVRAMSHLYGGERDTFLVTLKEVVKSFPKEEVTELANTIVKGLADGRILMDDRYDATSIWGRRNRRSTEEGEDSVVLKDERYSNFAFVLAYPTNSLDESQLLFEMARFNFTSFMVRNFDIEITELQGISMMAIKGFLSYDEVHSYAQQLYADEHMHRAIEGIRTLLISEDNLKLIGTEFSFDEYKEFYDEKFAPLDIPKDLQIDEPTDLEFLDPDEVDLEDLRRAKEKAEEEEGGEDDDDDFPWGF